MSFPRRLWSDPTPTRHLKFAAVRKIEPGETNRQVRSCRKQPHLSNLDWPEEFERTDPTDREPYPGGSQVTRSTAFQNGLGELQRWEDVTDIQVDSGAEHQKRNPNVAYANASFDDPGAVVRFRKDGDQVGAACDRWDNTRDNAQDLY